MKCNSRFIVLYTFVYLRQIVFMLYSSCEILWSTRVQKPTGNVVSLLGGSQFAIHCMKHAWMIHTRVRIFKE